MKENKKKNLIIGQEAVVPEYGLGRVVSFNLECPNYIEVRPYICDYTMKFDSKNVQLVKIILEEKENDNQQDIQTTEDNLFKSNFIEEFTRFILPVVIKLFGINDIVAVRKAWNIWLNSLYENKRITTRQYKNWDNPF